MRVDMSLAERVHVTLRAYDTADRAVSRIFEGAAGPGNVSVQWTPLDGSGRRLRPGVYFLRLQAGAQSVARRVVVSE